MSDVVLVALISGFFTSIIPLISNHLNHKHELNIKQIEINITIEKEIVDNFIDSVTDYIHSTPKNMEKCKKSYLNNLFKIRCYFPEIKIDNLVYFKEELKLSESSLISFAQQSINLITKHMSKKTKISLFAKIRLLIAKLVDALQHTCTKSKNN